MLFAAISIKCIANQQFAALYTVMFWLLGQKQQSLGKNSKGEKTLKHALDIGLVFMDSVH